MHIFFIYSIKRYIKNIYKNNFYFLLYIIKLIYCNNNTNIVIIYSFKYSQIKYISIITTIITTTIIMRKFYEIF